jgi:phosphatidylglycerophosphate synthase
MRPRRGPRTHRGHSIFGHSPAVTSSYRPRGRVHGKCAAFHAANSSNGLLNQSSCRAYSTTTVTFELFPGAFPCTIFVLLDMLDGALARIKGTSGTWGAFLDSTMDRIADVGIFGGLVVWFYGGGHNPLLGGVRLFGLVTGSLVC